VKFYLGTHQPSWLAKNLEVVGLGSVCRRQATHGIATIVQTLANAGIRLHGFGVKTKGLQTYGVHLASADTRLAWSYGGRRVPGCRPGHKSESNCLSFALAYHDRVQHARPATTRRPRAERG